MRKCFLGLRPADAGLAFKFVHQEKTYGFLLMALASLAVTSFPYGEKYGVRCVLRTQRGTDACPAPYVVLGYPLQKGYDTV